MLSQTGSVWDQVDTQGSWRQAAESPFEIIEVFYIFQLSSH